MRGSRLLRYCEERPERDAEGRIGARGVVHAARPGAYVTMCGAGLETLHLLGTTSTGMPPCPDCWEAGEP